MEHFYETVDGWFNFREIYDSSALSRGSGRGSLCRDWFLVRSLCRLHGCRNCRNSGKQIAFYCVDTWNGSDDLAWMAKELATKGGSAFPSFRDNMQRGGVWTLIKTLQQPSVQAARLFERESVDFIMVDGAHNYAGVRDDVRAWLPKLKQNGLMAGDDADWPGVLIGVHETIPFLMVNIVQ